MKSPYLKGMKRTHTITIAVLATLLLLALAVLRGQRSRELLLKMNGSPLANLRAQVFPHCGGAEVLETSTDVDGRLDLAAIPAWTETIAITLRDGTTTVFNGEISLAPSGSRTIDMRGNQSITTTTRTYADFILFRLTGPAATQVWTQRDESLP